MSNKKRTKEYDLQELNIFKCTKCDGELKDMNKSITTIDPKKNYGMITASLHQCLDCGHKLYVETGSHEEELE